MGERVVFVAASVKIKVGAGGRHGPLDDERPAVSITHVLIVGVITVTVVVNHTGRAVGAVMMRPRLLGGRVRDLLH